MKGGLGARAIELGLLRVGAVAVVNPCGNVVDPRTGSFIAGMRSAPDSLEIVSMEEAMLADSDGLSMPLDRTNTTISCIITNARLTKAQATKVAQMAADATRTPSAPRILRTTATPSMSSPPGNSDSSISPSTS